jgi:hypothetical protein
VPAAPYEAPTSDFSDSIRTVPAAPYVPPASDFSDTLAHTDWGPFQLPDVDFSDQIVHVSFESMDLENPPDYRPRPSFLVVQVVSTGNAGGLPPELRQGRLVSASG